MRARVSSEELRGRVHQDESPSVSSKGRRLVLLWVAVPVIVIVVMTCIFLMTPELLASSPIASTSIGVQRRMRNSGRNQSSSTGTYVLASRPTDGPDIVTSNHSTERNNNDYAPNSSDAFSGPENTNEGLLDRKRLTAEEPDLRLVVIEPEEDSKDGVRGARAVDNAEGERKSTLVESEPKRDNESSTRESSAADSRKRRRGEKRQRRAWEKDPAKEAPRNCDLFHGSWVDDPAGGPYYTNETCGFISEHQDCRGNGRPDHAYEGWRWKPRGCSLPRFDTDEFFRIMRRKTIAFVGDSVARNHMESLLCLLSQAEKPVNRGNQFMQRYSFPRKRVTLVRIWSAWLVREDAGDVPGVPRDLAKLHLDQVDTKWLQHAPSYDVLVLSSGHWWVKPSAFLLGQRLVGGQGWWAGDGPMRYNNTEAFRVAMESLFRIVTSLPRGNKALTVFRTWSPDHYEGGEWNTGGSCTGRETPVDEAQVWVSPFGALIRRYQLEAYAQVEREQLTDNGNGSTFQLMDVTPSFDFRADGHPGPYRNKASLDLLKSMEAGGPKEKQLPPQDCLHWCMPGPVDTWNEFLLQMLMRKFDPGAEGSSESR
eukprot:jgi/Mesen1/10862/ME000093S10375